MAEISAKRVADLRTATGLGMMECKKALVEAQGDMARATELLRIKSGAKASKLADRIASEGAICVVHMGQVAAMVEVNCETDFVAKDVAFQAFAKTVAEVVAQMHPADVAALGDLRVAEETIEEKRSKVMVKLGENITVRRFIRYETSKRLATYLHGTKIGVIVEFDGPSHEAGSDIAMHIAAFKPLCVSKEQVPAEKLATERHIYAEQARQSGKPADIIEKMTEGRLAKYLAEVTLLGQAFLRDTDITVATFLDQKKAQVSAFSLFVLGEGLEKKEIDYAAEVAAAAKN